MTDNMQLKRQDIELMAPAGSFEALMAAIQGGADAAYFGVGKLNMRYGSSKNFTFEDLPEIATICRENGIKSYLTVNTVLYDQDLEDMKALLQAAKLAGIDAVIASDHAAIQYAQSIGLPIHISTQCNISNIESVRFYAQYADVMVLARELNLDQMKTICDAIHKEKITGPSGKPVRIEVFAHGALCMAVSGKCYLSLHHHEASANRGRCRQECRKAYTVTEKESGRQLEIDNEYIMSPKDLSTIRFLDDLLDTGVKVLKLEGRGRSPEYVKTITQTYHEAIEAISEGIFDQEKILSWEERLNGVFNRGFWDGYYLGQKLGEWSEKYGSSATQKKVYVGKVTNYFGKLGVGEFLIESQEIHVGDPFLIIGPTTGVLEGNIPEIRYELKPVEGVQKGMICSIPVPEKVRRSDKLYKLVSRKAKVN